MTILIISKSIHYNRLQITPNNASFTEGTHALTLSDH